MLNKDEKTIEQSPSTTKKTSMFETNSKTVFSKIVDPTIYNFYDEELNEKNGFAINKIGDTNRGTYIRLKEWKKIYPNLKLAGELTAYFIDKNTGEKVYFRDYSIHKYLENNNYVKLIEFEYDNAGYEKISKEFYVNMTNNKTGVTMEALKNAIQDIQTQYYKQQDGSGFKSDYKYYNTVKNSLQEESFYKPVNSFKPRGIQQKTIDNVKKYFYENSVKQYNYNNYSSNSSARYLIVAPTRSGKTFMALNSVLEIFESSVKKHNVALVLSAVADVMEEWKKGTESHTFFNQKEYGSAEENRCGHSPCKCITKLAFVNIERLKSNPNIIKEMFDKGEAENVVVFLTLQDLAGSTASNASVKKTHEWLTEQNVVDLIVSDESHIAAFTEQGRYNEIWGDIEDRETKKRASANLQSVHPTYGSLYITATPFKVLAEKVFFNDSNTTVITKDEMRSEREKWDYDNTHNSLGVPKNPDEIRPEWENPYFGIPEETHFSFNIDRNINELFEPVNINNGTKGFVNAKEAKVFIENFINLILEDENYKNAGLGRNIFITLPYRASCDAFNKLLVEVFREKGLLDDWDIINTSSTNSKNKFNKMSAAQIVDYIKNSDKKTCTLTVNRLGTGVTVEKWDTVFFMRKIDSPQQWVQIAGRVGSPWVEKHSTDDDFIKTVEKQNVAVISFDTSQMLSLNIQKITSISEAKNNITRKNTLGNEILQKEIDKELKETKTYIKNFYDNNVLEKVTSVNIYKKLFETNKNRGVRELSERIPVSTFSITPEIKTMVDDYETFVKTGAITLNIFEQSDEQKNISVEKRCIKKGCNNVKWVDDNNVVNELCETHVKMAENILDGFKNLENKRRKDLTVEEKREVKELKDLESKVRDVYTLILLYALLSDDDESSLFEIINNVKTSFNKNVDDVVGRRNFVLASHLGLNLEVLEAFKKAGLGGNELDMLIMTINQNFNRDTSTVWDKFRVALNSFDRFTPNEIPTPDDVVNLVFDKLALSDDDFSNFVNSGLNGVIDNGCKSAAFLVGFYERAVKAGVSHEVLRNRLWAVPTSSATFELIRKVFVEYDFNVDNILFCDGVSNLDVLRILEFAVESKFGCQHHVVDDCMYHGNSKVAKKMRKGIGVSEKFPKMTNDSEKDTINVKSYVNNIGSKIFNDIIDKITDDNLLREIEGFCRMVIERTEKFDYCISNPPYQLAMSNNSSGQSSVKNIFQDFHIIGCKISNNSTMIYPAYRWLQGGGKGLDYFVDFMRNNKGLKSVDIFSSKETKNMFNVQIPDGVCITCINNDYDNKNVIKINGNNMNIKNGLYVPTNLKNLLLINTMEEYMKNNNYNSINNRKLGRSFYGIESDWVEKNPDLVFTENDKAKIKNPVKLLTNNISGTAGTSCWFYVDESVLKTTKYVDCFKVITKSAMLNAKDHLKIAEIIGPQTAVGRAKIIISSFKTKQEAENFLQYLRTEFSQKLYEESISAGLKGFAKFVPDLVDYSNDNPVFTPSDDLPDNHEYKNLSLNERLYKKFNFTEEEINSIENSLS